MDGNIPACGRAAICVILLMAGYGVSDEVCHLMIRTCPELLDGRTIEVPLSAVAVHPEVKICEPEIEFQGTARVQPSIMLVIDDSWSMHTNDSLALRYEVTKEVLDEIYESSPKTRVGIVVFRNWLAWDHRSNDLYRKIDDPRFEWNDSYFPLTRLDTVFGDGDSGLEKVKEALSVDTTTYSDGSVWRHLVGWHHDSTERTRPDCDPSTLRTCGTKGDMGTDVTLAFWAAKDAMKESPTPAQRQFVLFLTDGQHGREDAEMKPYATDYLKGDSVPTTFSIFFGASLPRNLSTMTSSIRSNGYSEANSSTDIWQIESSHDTLLHLMRKAILTEVFKAEVDPVAATFQGDTIRSATDTSVLFNRLQPLEADTTSNVMSISFSFIDTAGVAANPSGDTTISSQFRIVRSSSASWSDVPAGVTRVCYERRISVAYRGTPVSGTIKNSYDSLEAVLLLEGISPSSAQQALVTNSAGTDTVSLTLEFRDSVFVGGFSRTVGADPISGDATLQHALADSARIVWRNPEVPLDTARASYRILAYDPVNILSVTYRDDNADGYIDALQVKTSSGFNPREIDRFKESDFTFPADRKLTYRGAEMLPDSSGFTILVSQDRSVEINTAVNSESDSLRIHRYAVGPYEGFVEAGAYAIRDGMAPVIVKAVYAPGKLDGGEGDALRVWFSEDVPRVTTAEPFGFVKNDRTSYTMTLRTVSDSGAKHTFRIQSMTPSNVTVTPGDSTWLTGTAGAGDTRGNVQTRNTPRAPLDIDYPAYEFESFAAPNPFVPGKMVNTYLPGLDMTVSGAVIGVQVATSRDSALVRVRKARAVIYDAVGNTVREELPGVRKGSSYYFEWDGYNRNNRVVGSGTYLVVMRVTSVMGGKTQDKVERVKIGVKR